MPDVMEFPKYWEDFVKDYSFKDDQHIYTNGSELISIYRVKQMVEHYFSTAAGAMVQAVEKDFRDSNSRVDVSKNGCVTLRRSDKDWVEVDENNYITQECLNRMNKDIENYNKGIVSEPVDLSYVELEDYIPKDIREKCELGEFNDGVK